SYDQEFFANIYLMQADGSDPKQLARNAERFDDMLNDRKNSDLKDKIYFTMGRIDARRGNYDRALVNFNKAVQAGLTNTAQVPLTYAEMGNLYFEKKRDYARAQAYYDSSLALLPQNHALYTTLANRKKSLDEFVTNQTTIDLEDSLQRMAQMNPAALDQLLDKIIDQREKADAAQAELAQQVTGRTNLSGAQATNSNLAPNDRWVLYNPVQMAQGKQEFMQVWGNRPLADDWRRQNKDASQAIASENNPLNGTNPANATNPAAPLPTSGTRPAVANTLNLRKSQKEELYRQIPFSAEALQKSNDLLESALYRQGKLYKFQLDQPLQTISTLDRLLARFPNSTYKPEAYYLLHLSTEQAGKSSPWGNKLLAEFPTSSYAKLLLAAGSNTPLAGGNTSSGNGSVNEIAASQTYTQLYDLYQSGNSTEALARVEAALGTFGGSKIADKMALLRIVLIGRIQGVDAYRQALSEFVRDYPLSPLLSHIKERQVAAEQLSAKRK
ncbi:MAG TPA: tetratricopeptide repeat protein, partial [Fibrella sp.]